MSTGNSVNIAGRTEQTLDAAIPDFAGDGDINTVPDTIAQYASGVIPRLTPLTRDGTSGKLKPQTLTTEKIDGITVYPVDARTGDVKQSVYVGGYFNMRAINWGAAFTTDALKSAARTGKLIFRPVD